LPEVPDEEITRVGSSPRASSPISGNTLLGGPRSPHALTPGSAAYAAPVLPPTPPAPLTAPISPSSERTAAFQSPAQAPSQPPSQPLGGFQPVSVGRSSPPAPLLIDVTPLTLAVETVNGFCDAIIERNTQVPCERSRVFVTAVDNQTLVRVRISQGESSHFDDNTLLGEVDLYGLAPAPRGDVQIAVSFSLDTGGMLNVSAKEVATGRATSAQVRLVALPDASEITRMIQRNAARQI
jgi:molecular chaperone DnaK